MLTTKPDFLTIAEVNPPELPDMSHLRLDGVWDHVLITDNVFGRIRVSPYAYAARITHDVPRVHPTVVVSTRDRNILAIESEVRGAIGNGVDSFLVVIGDTMPAVDHLADHYEIVEHLRGLQESLPAFEVGMPTRFRRWQFDKRVEVGAQFFVAGPVLDPSTVEPNLGKLALTPDDPPVYLAVMPPFSPSWVAKAEGWGAVPCSAEMKRVLDSVPKPERRSWAWQQVDEIRRRAERAGAAGIVLMGLSFETLVGEARLMFG